MSLLVGFTMFTGVAFAGTSDEISNKSTVDDTNSSSTVEPNNVRENKEVQDSSENQKMENWPAPVEAAIIAEFCYGKDMPAGSNFNAGVNFDVKLGEPVKAVADGAGIFAGYFGSYGLGVIIDHGDGLATLYAHALQTKVSEGEKVKAGDVICLAGKSGNVTRPMLHFEVRKHGEPVNPRKYLKEE